MGKAASPQIPPSSLKNVYARSDLSDAWGRYLEAPAPSVEPPQDPTVEELDEMDPLREEREQDTADAILF